MVPAMKKAGAQIPCYATCRRAVEKTIECKAMKAIAGSDPCQGLPTGDGCMDDYAGYLEKKSSSTPTTGGSGSKSPKPTSTTKANNNASGGDRKKMQRAAIIFDVLVIAASSILLLLTL